MWWEFAAYAEGRGGLRQGLEATGDAPPSLVASACGQAGSPAATAGDVDDALPLHDRSNELLGTGFDPTLDDLFTMAQAVYLKGNALVALGRFAEAEPCFEEAVARFGALGSDVIVAFSTLRLAAAAYGSGALERARRHLDGMAEVIAIDEEFDYPYAEEEVLARPAVVASALGEHEAAATAVATARASGHVGLTRREREVVREVAAGKSNREIAERLFISEATVKRHLTTVFGKLNVPSRSALNTFAHAHGLGPGGVEQRVRSLSGGRRPARRKNGETYDFGSMRPSSFERSMEAPDVWGAVSVHEEARHE